MASQEIPKYYDPLVELLEDAADGAESIGVAVGIKQNDGAALRAALVALVGAPAGPGNVPPAVPGFKAVWNAAKAAKTAKTGAFVSKKSEGRTLAASCVNILKPRLGNAWSNAWQTAGFTNGSLEIPGNPLALLQQLRAYFTANPTHEVADLGLTAAACHAMAQGISTASSESNASNTAAGTAKTNLANGMKAARRRLTGLREELGQLLEDADERWYTFGFSRPSDPETPEVPENLTAVPGAPGSGELAADWDEARRAVSYRATVKNAGSGAVVASKLVTDGDADFEGLPVGVALRVEVTAINDAGESVASAPVAITLPGAVLPPIEPQNTSFTQEPTPGADVVGQAEPDATATAWGVYADGSLVATSPALPVVFTIAPGTYNFTMTRSNAGGESPQSSPAVQVNVV